MPMNWWIEQRNLGTKVWPSPIAIRSLELFGPIPLQKIRNFPSSSDANSIPSMDRHWLSGRWIGKGTVIFAVC